MVQCGCGGWSWVDFYLELVRGVEGVVGNSIKSDYLGGRHILIRNRLYNSSYFYSLYQINLPFRQTPPTAAQHPEIKYPYCPPPFRRRGCIISAVIRPREYNLIMPRYVPKEDVEKGLVDPSKSLEEQP